MAEISSTARVVIIGGGVVGASTLYHLAKMGWSDCVLLEKNELTAGSTWHAAGNVPTFSTSWSVLNMQRYSTDLYRRLSDEVDYPMNYHVTGALRLAHTKTRRQEFERVASMSRHLGLEIEILEPNEIKDYFPFMETHDLECAKWDPVDGDIDPAQLTQAFAKGARDLGAKIHRFCPATGVSRENGEWIVHTDKGDIRCEYVVNAAGYYAQKVGEWFKPFGGRTVPITVMSHQYLIFEEVPEIKEWSQAHGGDHVPMVRDVDTSYYLRQENYGFNLGPYEADARSAWTTADHQMPDDFSFQLFPDDLDRLEFYIEDVMARVPVIAEAGLSKVINGPIPYAPDGLPLIGPMPGVPNAFEATAFTFGIAQAGGAGKIMAEWITEGEPEWDMWAVDPRRFTDYTNADYCEATAKEVYGHEYGMHFPWRRWPAGADQKHSPVHDKIKGMGPVLGAYNGWERADWFPKDGDDLNPELTHTWGRSGPWEPRVREEVEAVRDGVGVLDLPGFSRFSLSGEGAAEWLRGMIAGALPKAGRMTLGYFLNDKGRILTEMSIIRHGEDEFTLITAAIAQWHDYEVLKSKLPDGLSLTDRTNEFDTLIVCGPESRALFEKISDADLSLGWLTHQRATIAGKSVMMPRVSYAGELGWEVHAENADMPAIYDAVIAAGAKPFGMWALNSMRVEKGYRAWKHDLSTDYTLLEGGLGRFGRPNKPQDFPGKAALLKELEDGPAKTFATLIVDAGDEDAPYMSTIWKGDEIVGETTSGEWGYRVNASIALACVRTDLTEPGTELEVEIYGVRRRAVVQPDQPLWDPENERLRA